MSVAIGSAKSTASRIARTLESEGFLVRSRNSPRYRLGLTLWERGCQAVGENMEFPRHAHPYLEEIVTSVNESAHAVILDDGEALHVEKVDAGRSIQTFTTLDARYPVHCTATGKSMLAFQSEERIEAVLSSQLARYTERTITDSAKLRQNLAQVRARGFAMAKGEWRLDIGGIAAPVRDRTGNVFGALGVTMRRCPPSAIRRKFSRGLLTFCYARRNTYHASSGLFPSPTQRPPARGRCFGTIEGVRAMTDHAIRSGPLASPHYASRREDVMANVA